MEDNLKQLQQNEIDAAKDSHDRRWACDAMSEDYFKYSKDAAEHTKIALDIQRMENEYEIELKKLELEKMKLDFESYKADSSNSLKNPKFWIEEVGIPVTLKMLGLMTWTTMFMMGSKYEKSDITTLSGMKGVMRCITDGVAGVFKGDRV